MTRYEAVGAVLCKTHPDSMWHMPEEGCHACAMAARSPEEIAADQTAWDAWWEKVKANSKPMAPEEAEKMRALVAERKSGGPGVSTGVMMALIARKREMMMACEKDTGPLRERMRALYDDDDYELHDMIIGAADAIDNLRRKRHWWRKMAEAWEEFADAFHKNDTPRLKAAGDMIAEARKALMGLGVKAPTLADKTRAATEPN